MEKPKFSAGSVAKKTLAVVSSAALLMSCGVTTTLTSIAPTGIVAQAATNIATKLKILDENGKDLGDNPVFYVDNSKVNGDNLVSTGFQVIASNDSGVAVDDDVELFEDGGADDHIIVSSPGSSARERMNVRISGGRYNYDKTDKDGNPVWEAKKPGTTHLHFTTSNGDVYRTVTVVVYEPATDMNLFQVLGKGKSKLDVNDDNAENRYGAMVIANHKYQFAAEKVSAASTDTVEWAVYDGRYTGSGTPNPTKKAEITQSGLFTPKSNGQVTIVAKYKATETSTREKSYGKKKLGDTPYDSYLNVPKYINVTIVKENPATSIAITNAPSAMEINDTMKLSFDSVPTYTGSGYESGATDVFTWRSTNPNVVTVDDEGNITAVGKGDAKIIVSGENDNVSAEADIKVLTLAQSISFKEKTISTRVGVETLVTAVMNPATADEEIEWSSSDPSIATVTSNVSGAFTNEQSAVVKGIKTGSVILTARAKNSGREANITCNITKKIDAAAINLTTQSGSEIKNIIQGETVRVFDQKTIKIDASLVSADGTSPDDSIVWTVLGNGENNGDYVTIDEQTSSSITITGFARGTVTVKATSKNNSSISKSFKLQVLKKATKGVIVNMEREDKKYNKNLNVGTTLSLGGDIFIETNQPYDHDDRVAHWTSSNTKAIEIDDSGYLRVVGNGVSNITMITESGYSLSTQITGFTTSSITITGVSTQTDGSLPRATITLNNKMTGTKTLGIVVKNEKDNAVSDRPVQWSSSNENIVSVDENGKLTAHNIGNAEITAKSGNKSDTCVVYVDYPLGNATVELGSVTYSPLVEAYEPEVKVFYVYTETDILGRTSSETVFLDEGIDYRLEYSNNTTVGQTGVVKIIGIGDYYSASATKTFKINARPINDVEVVVDPIEDQELTAENKKTGGAKAPVRISHFGQELTENVDYTLAYTNVTAPGTATVKITGKGNYSGTTTATYTIYCNHTNKTLSSHKVKATCKQEGIDVYKCDVCGKTFEEVLPLTDHNFVKGTVVKPTYDDEGYTIYKCSVCGETENRDFVPALSRTALSKCTITLDKEVFVETSSAQKPRVTVKNGSTTLRENTDYTLTYSDANSKVPGKYSVKIVGIGGYSGTATKYYTIERKKIEASSITLNKTSETLEKSKTLKLTVTFNPTNTDDKSLTWTSSDSTIASVSGGTVTAKKVGTATITAKTANNRSANCKITVVELPTGVKLSKTAVTLMAGASQDVTATITPSTATNKTLTWTSSNMSVATVSNGKIMAKSAGTSTVTVKTANGKTATCKVTVKAAPTAIKISNASLSLGVNETYNLTTTITPSNAFNTVTWTSSNASIVTVSNGKLTAKKAGTATITVKTANNKSATCKVTVKPAASSVKLDKSAVTIGIGESFTVSAIIPSNAAAATRTFSSSNSSVVQMTKTNWVGVFKGVKAGTANVTVKLQNGKTATCKVTVKAAATSVKLDKTAVTIGIGETYTVSAIIPANTAAANRTYSSSNGSVVQMTKTNWTGSFKGLKVGTANVTVKLQNGKTATCKVTVKKAPTTVGLSKTTLNMKVGQTATLSATIPSDAGCATRNFRSSNSSIVKMTKTSWTGSFKALKKGTAYVTVRTYNGKEKSCKVVVS